MLTVVVPTANRPEMLRTALRSIEAQVARKDIGAVLVSENSAFIASEKVCAEFPSLPITYVVRTPPTGPLEHGVAIFNEARNLPGKYVAVLHDDDWWGNNHLLNGLHHLEASSAAVAYWSSSFLVDGEASWFRRNWNIACWLASGFGALNEVAKLDARGAALACLGSAPAHYSSLIAEKHAVAEAYSEVAKTGRLLDNDRLLFLALAKRGAVLVNLVPEVFIRQHQAQDQLSFSSASYREQAAASTRAVLEFGREQGIEPVKDFVRLYEECPIPRYRAELMEAIAPGVLDEMRRYDATSTDRLMRLHRRPKWLAQQLVPPLFWETAREMKSSLQRARSRAR